MHKTTMQNTNPLVASLRNNGKENVKNGKYYIAHPNEGCPEMHLDGNNNSRSKYTSEYLDLWLNTNCWLLLIILWGGKIIA